MPVATFPTARSTYITADQIERGARRIAHNSLMRNIEQEDWLPALRRYFAAMLLGNLAWEILQLPLYTLWVTGTWRDKAFAVAHCTGGDMLIGAACLLGGLLVAGDKRWPNVAFWRVAGISLAAGIAYTIFSEWLNTTVRLSWSYAEAMPIVPGLRVGLSPLLQWVFVPLFAFWIAQRRRQSAATMVSGV